MHVPSQIPTTIFTGFLGSGKTTIILPLIENLQARGQQVIYIKNEIGEVDIDSQLMRGEHIISKELLNGCICCTLVGPFMAAAEEIAKEYHPDRIIIEASGAADPSAIALMVSSHPQLYRDGVISVVDVVNFKGYSNLSITAQRQASFTDLIIFNKVEQVDIDHKRAVVGYVRELNTHAPIVEAPHGMVDPQLVFGVDTKELQEMLEASSHSAGQIHSQHLNQDHLESFTCRPQRPLQEHKLLEALSQLPTQIFRVKGYVQLSSEKMKVINKVGTRVELTEPPTNLGFRPTQIVCIGFDVLALKENICALLKDCS